MNEMTQRDIHLQKIEKAQNELSSCGPIHRRDLQKYIKRLYRELKQYDRYRQGGCNGKA